MTMNTRAHIHRLRSRLTGQDGMAMIMAVLVTTVLLTLVGGAVTVSVQGSGATTHDDSTKAADEAVEAGLRVATYRLNQIQPSDTTCINNNSAVTPTNGTCQDTTETLANGSTFTYWTTPPLGSGNTCVGNPITSSSLLTQRCITASATAYGVTRRAQVRVVSYAGSPLFPAPGLVGLDGISLNNQAHINGSATTNAALTMQNQAIIVNNGTNAVELGPSGTATTASGATYPTPALKRTAAQGPFTLSPVDPGDSAINNADGNITAGINNPNSTPSDPSTKCTIGTTANSCWNPSARTLNLNNQATLTLTGGVYNFCSLSINNQAKLIIANGARPAIYIDSASRSGSGCPSTQIANGGPSGSGGYAGYFNLDNQGVISNPSLDPTAVIVYIYDNSGAVNNSDGMLHENNQGTFYGTIYAPQSAFHLDNQAGIVGGVAADKLVIDNQFTFSWDSRDANLASRTSGVYFRSAWRECQPAPPDPNDPQSGC